MIESRHFCEIMRTVQDLLELNGLSQPTILSLKRIRDLLVLFKTNVKNVKAYNLIRFFSVAILNLNGIVDFN